MREVNSNPFSCVCGVCLQYNSSCSLSCVYYKVCLEVYYSIYIILKEAWEGIDILWKE